MADTFRVVDVSDVPQGPLEQMGTKDKFWIEWEGERWLFKNGRENTGEHWAEKLAEAVAGRLKIPVAEVHLSVWKDQLGTISRTFLNKSESLTHGNELMPLVVEEYDTEKRFGQSDHRLDRVLACLEAKVPNDIDQFIGYLTLDALIGNTDRHHENWGIISAPDKNPRIAPSYDHASSLGRELLDPKIEQHMKDVSRYLEKGSGGIFSPEGKKCSPGQLLATLDVLGYSRSRIRWRNVLQALSIDDILVDVDRIPEGWITAKGRAFACEVIRCGFERIVGEK